MSGAPRPSMARLYERGKVVSEGFGVEDIDAQLRAHPGAVLWLDLFDPGIEELQPVAAHFGLHPLAVEDAVHDHQRPKLDRYPGHLFMNVYAVQAALDAPAPELHKTEISSFITERALITVHKSQGDTDALMKRWEVLAPLATDASGVSFLLYGMLDLIVDGQFAAARRLDEAMDQPEDEMLGDSGAPRSVRRYGFALRRTAAALRRVVAPMPDVIADLLRAGDNLVDEHLEPYFRDIDDHARRATETIENAGIGSTACSRRISTSRATCSTT
jgi:magnesium transporter